MKVIVAEVKTYHQKNTLQNRTLLEGYNIWATASDKQKIQLTNPTKFIFSKDAKEEPLRH